MRIKGANCKIILNNYLIIPNNALYLLMKKPYYWIIMAFIASLKEFCIKIQHSLLPLCEKTLGSLTKKHEDLIKSLELIDIDSYFRIALIDTNPGNSKLAA